MALKENSPQQLSSRVSVVRGIPLHQVLPEADGFSQIRTDRVSVYRVSTENGVEYDLQFPPLAGDQLHSRLTAISKIDPGIGDVRADMRSIAYNAARLERHHQGLGILWETFYGAIGPQIKVLEEARSIPERNDLIKELSVARRTLVAISNLSHLDSEDVFIDDPKREALEQLRGNAEVDIVFLSKFFELKVSDMRKLGNKARAYSRRRMDELLRGKGSEKQMQSFSKLALEASKKKIQYTNNEGEEYNDEAISDYAANYVDNVSLVDKEYVRVKAGNRYFKAPREDYQLLTKGRFKHSVMLEVDPEGAVICSQESVSMLTEYIASIDSKLGNGSRLVPIIRYFQNNSGVSGFIFNETQSSPMLDKTVQDDIYTTFQKSDTPILSVEEGGLSGMVGIDMIIAASPSTKSIPDSWSSIWQRDRIMYSQVSGIYPQPGVRESDQINGPVQAGIIALHALARYPDHFVPLIQNFKARFDQKENE